MKKITLLLLLLFNFNFAFSQSILSEYPVGQSPYKGGFKALFADLQAHFEKTGNNPCTDSEMIWITLKIDEKGQPFLIKKISDNKSINNNKCAYETITKALATLNKWQPATNNGKPVTAYFDFSFIPSHFFENYIPDYNIITKITKPVFEGGIDAFRNEVHKNLIAYIDYSSYTPWGTFTVSFEIDKNGKLSNIDVEPKLPKSELFVEDMIYSYKKVKQKWTPATLNGKPITYKYRMPWYFMD